MTHGDAGAAFHLCALHRAPRRDRARPSIGTAANCSFDRALVESFNGLYKTECVYGPDANGSDDVSSLELATPWSVH
jgi:putative transposase